ncbi:TVP38/TMEM64 family protein [Planctobacterium marinum]|uniref:TVP38/TMEM64 family protein n=1 Tax=Planctobacterium marinum TaxID=1631968 RepID=UPI001E2B2540|nr:VTT domain-containing protein [Planctobacterium marinum]MCC2606969.1 VTT domain-containing protein [Planctobacterium marinum]
MKNRKWINLTIAVTIAATLLAVYFLTPLKSFLTIDKVVHLTEEVPVSWVTALAFLLLFFFGGALLIPIPLMSLAVSLIFPTWLSVLIVLPGFALAATGGYLLGQFVDDSLWGESVTKHIDKIKSKLENQVIYAVMALRIAPTPPFTITSMLSGMLKVDYPKYIVGSVLGIMPLGLSAVFFGRGALEMVKEPSGMAATTLIAAVVLTSVFFVIKRHAK